MTPLRMLSYGGLSGAPACGFSLIGCAGPAWLTQSPRCAPNALHRPVAGTIDPAVRPGYR